MKIAAVQSLASAVAELSVEMILPDPLNKDVARIVASAVESAAGNG